MSTDADEPLLHVSKNWASCLVFNWVNPLMARGSARQLQASDLFPLPRKLLPSTCSSLLWRIWAAVRSTYPLIKLQMILFWLHISRLGQECKCRCKLCSPCNALQLQVDVALQYDPAPYCGLEVFDSMGVAWMLHCLWLTYYLHLESPVHAMVQQAQAANGLQCKAAFMHANQARPNQPFGISLLSACAHPALYSKIFAPELFPLSRFGCLTIAGAAGKDRQVS